MRALRGHLFARFASPGHLPRPPSRPRPWPPSGGGASAGDSGPSGGVLWACWLRGVVASGRKTSGQRNKACPPGRAFGLRPKPGKTPPVLAIRASIPHAFGLRPKNPGPSPARSACQGEPFALARWHVPCSRPAPDGRATNPARPSSQGQRQRPRQLRPAGLSRPLLPANVHNVRLHAPALRAVGPSGPPCWGPAFGPRNQRYVQSREPSQGPRQPARRGHASGRALSTVAKQASRALSPAVLRAPLRPAPPGFAAPRPSPGTANPHPYFQHCAQRAGPVRPHQGRFAPLRGAFGRLDPAGPALRMVAMPEAGPSPLAFGLRGQV